MSSRPSAQPKNPRSHGVSAPLSRRLSLPEQRLEQVAALPQLDVLWHFDCVVSPRSHAVRGAKLQNTAASPLSPAGNSSAAASTAPARDHSHNQDHRIKQALQRVFHTFDENGDGKVSIDEIFRIFEKLGIDFSMESLLARLITKSEGHVDEQEFLSLYEFICSPPPDVSASSSNLQADVDQDLLAAFHVFDKDGNGFISPAELQSVLCSLGFPQGRQLEACVDMIARVDENGDGLVDFSEFKSLFHTENPFLLISSY